MCYPSNSLFNYTLKTNRYLLYLLYFLLLCAHIKMNIVVLINDTKIEKLLHLKQYKQVNK